MKPASLTTVTVEAPIPGDVQICLAHVLPSGKISTDDTVVYRPSVGECEHEIPRGLADLSYHGMTDWSSGLYGSAEIWVTGEATDVVYLLNVRCLLRVVGARAVRSFVGMPSGARKTHFFEIPRAASQIGLNGVSVRSTDDVRMRNTREFWKDWASEMGSLELMKKWGDRTWFESERVKACQRLDELRKEPPPPIVERKIEVAEAKFFRRALGYARASRTLPRFTECPVFVELPRSIEGEDLEVTAGDTYEDERRVFMKDGSEVFGDELKNALLWGTRKRPSYLPPLPREVSANG